jgi:hypothetical protein
VLDLIKILLTSTAPSALWIVGGSLAILFVFVGVSLAVALFASDASRANRARSILRDLLNLLTFTRRR